MEHHLRLGAHRELQVEQLVATSEFSHGNQQPGSPSSYLQYLQANLTSIRALVPEVDKRPMLSRQLALSWVLILVIAPLLVSLLVWLLVLILRRASQTRLLLPRDTSLETLGHSSSLWSISSSSSRSSSFQSQLRLKNNVNHHEQRQARPWKQSTSNNHQQEPHRRLKLIQRLMERTNLYLLTLTYQQILACFVAFSLAIVNIMRMRNLFYCNLVIFILVTSKILNLLTLVTFSISKLFLLFRLRPLSSTYEKDFSSVVHGGKKMSTCDGAGEDEEGDEKEFNDESDAEAKITSENHGTTSSSTNSSQTTISISGQDEASGSQMEAESELIKLNSSHKNRERRRRRRRSQCCSSSAEGEGTNATIKRLITKGQITSKQHQQQPSTFIWSTSAGLRASGVARGESRATAMATGGHLTTIKPPHEATQPAKPALCRLFSLMLLASGLALVCLYLRLMPPTSPVIPRTPFPFTTTSQNNSARAQPAAISTTTTSLPPPSTTTPSEPSRPNYQGWAARLQQSPAWRQLVDQYNLGTFLQVILDTQLQTSHFSCSIIGGNYSASSRLSMATAYGALVALVFLVSLATGQLGERQLRKFEASFLDFDSHLHQSCMSSSISSFSSNGRGNMLQQGAPSKTDSNRKRYSELLKQNIRHHHRSALEIHQQKQQLQHLPGVSSKNAPLLRGSSSMSSLLAGGAGKALLKPPPPLYASASSRHQKHPACLGTGAGHTSMSQVGQHQLAWIPLGGAATVASLSNMKGGWSPNVLPATASGSSSAGRIYRQRRQQPRQPCSDQPLGAIHERQTLGHPAPTSSRQHQQACQTSGQHERRCHVLRLELEMASCNRISHSEIRADLRLAHAMILLGQLLDQAPVLLLLTLACLLPEGTLEANWNSAHDNAFVWLTLIEALLFPLLLCLLDERISLALKRSLRCSSSSAGFDKTSGLTSLAELGCAGYQQRADHLMLGPPVKHPDLNSMQTNAMLGPLARNPLYQVATSSKTGRSCHTGPPYPVPSFGTYADDGSHDTLRANFALVGKTTQQELLPNDLLTPAALLAHQRQRRRRRSKSALLNVTRRILKLGRTKAYQRAASRRAGAGSGYALEGGGAPGNNSTSSSAAGGTETNQRCTSGRLSPTSSLSTLIRKFNHDNYTSVCQQYQQRKAQVAREQLVELGAEANAASTNEGCLIEGLDMPSSSGMHQTGATDLTITQDHQNILCRKGGLYYNYCLDSEPPAPSVLGARMNPMLEAGGLQPFVVDTVVRGCMSSLLEDKLKLDESVADEPQQQQQTTGAPEPSMSFGQQQVNQLKEEDESNDKRKQPAASKTSVETSKEWNRRGKATRKKPEGETGSKVASKGAATTTSNNNNNNHTIISNLTSVQELLDKMNGMMGCNEQQLPENKANSSPKQQAQPQPQSQIFGDGSQSKPAMDTCVSVRQANSRQSAGQERPTAADALEYMSLDYTSLDDALSLVSVSSEFEYHNINRDELRMASGAAAVSSAKPSDSPRESVLKSDKERPSRSTTIDSNQSSSPHEERNLLLVSATSSLLSSSSSSAGTSSDTNKRLNNLRFPSFLPTQPVSGASQPNKTASEVSRGLLISERNRAPRASARASSTSTSTSTNSSSQANFQKRINSSSLLNLTVAKFGMAAAALVTNGVESDADDKQLAKQQLPHRFAGSSNTIVKQKGGSRRMLEELTNEAGDKKQVAESSPRVAESGHVRARIRKMEQQSEPNLNSSQQLSQQQQQQHPGSPSNSKSRLPTLQVANSPIIPTTSKLPVPVSGHLLQHQRSSQPTISSSSSPTDINHSPAKRTTKQPRTSSSSTPKYR